MSKILIVGAGDVGGRIAIELAELGHEVWALRRTPQANQSFSSGGKLMWSVCDVTKAETLKLPLGLDIVISALAPSESGMVAYEQVYVGGARALQQALKGQSLNRQFWLSSTGVYGEDAGEWIDEATPAQPKRDTAKLLLQAEDVVRQSPWPSTIVRLGGLYGPGRERLLRWVRDAKPVQMTPPSWTNRLHVADAAGLVVHLVQQSLAGGRVESLLLGVDDAPTPQHEVLAWLAQQLELPSSPDKAVVPNASQGKRISNLALHRSGYALSYPSFRDGYLTLLPKL
ncbi:MAG: NAD(P)H-binding protein [Paraperlucidibaca sp.]|uniref:NAD(P)H-binding protein n=1 Tax=Paraperlucidibaca sp. TaxID=2708021 RepID=UPI001B58911C|nr:NAD(P)H-binding protein [Paraperlucidibaca sp.]MBQ0723022.1 NAD(P)H-binding protein [Paraperlucidibaca sp.]MBQ0841747.1 NAD(P)H-binding protein [Paraperlucidibaca sp.]